jgi:hypothetical protein
MSAREAGGRPLRSHALAERKVQRGFDVEALVGAGRGRDVAAEFFRRTLRPDADGAAGRVAAEHRALRAAQHFDAIDLDELVGQEAGSADLPNAVDVGADARNAAHAEVRAAGAAAAARDEHVRDALADFFEVIDAARLEAVARDRDDRDRNLLQVLLAAGRRDDDLLEPLLRERGLIRQTTDARQCRHDCCVDFVDFHRTPKLKN